MPVAFQLCILTALVNARNHWRAIVDASDESYHLVHMLKHRRQAGSIVEQTRRAIHLDRSGAAISFGLLTWIVVISLGAADLVRELLGFSGSASIARSEAQPETVTAAALTIATCVIMASLGRVIRPSLTWPVLGATSGVIILTTAMTTASILPLGAATLICAVALVGGELLLSTIPGAPSDSLVRLPLAFGLGLGLFSFLWLVLAIVGRFDTISIVLATGLVTAALFLAANTRTQRRQPINWDWRQTPPGWYETILVSFSAGLITFALVAAFVPETAGDATRQHLPIAREFWQAHGALVLHDMPVTRQAIANHVVLAVAYGAGGITAAKLLQAAIAIGSIFGVAALGWLCRGRFAALISLCAFGTIPVVLWEVGHAFIDMLPVLLTTCALACVLLWQREDRYSWLVIAGAITGVGVSAKLNMIAVVIAIPIAVLVVGRASWNTRQRLVACVAFCLGAVTLLPWLVYNTIAAGPVAVLEPVLSRLPGSFPRPSEPPPIAAMPAGEAAGDSEFTGPSALWVPFGHEAIDLIRAPWLLTFHGDKFAYPIIGRGEIGVVPLLLVPISLFGFFRRPTLLLAIVAAITYVAWWLSPYQIARHLLPVLAIVAALGGSGLASLVEVNRTRGLLRVSAVAAQTAVAVGILLTSLFFVSSFRAQLPVAFLSGAESHDAFVRRSVRAAGPLLASDELLPPGTPVAYLGAETGGAQLYTEAQLVFFPFNDAGASAQQVLDTLASENISYIIWHRGETPARDSSSTIRSTPFLRQYTRILAGDNDAYLFEVLPAGNTIWGEATVTNLLQDPGLQEVRNAQNPWTMDGKRVTATGVIALQRGSTLMQEVPVIPGQAYLLETSVRCLENSGRAILTLRWLDTQGNAIATASERTMPRREISEQFIWRRAPEHATRVAAEFSMAGQGRCEFYGAALYELP